MKKNDLVVGARLLKSSLIVLSLFLSNLVSAQLVGYTLASSNSATSGIAVNYPSQGRTVEKSAGLTNISSGFSATNGWTCYGWTSAGSSSWYTSSFSTEGYINISGSFQMKANTKYGPRDFKIQYSVNSGSWEDATTGSTITLTNFLTNYSFTLPSACENQSDLRVRWVLNSDRRLDGGQLLNGSNYNASLKGISIAGDAFSAPSTQASNISIVSVTPTTITVGCTNGNGNNRIIVINTVESFTDPSNDEYPTANATYGGSGEQVIYNGTGSKMTVTVPSSTNVYYFRVYEFNKMSNLTRYIADEASQNPKECRLETIHTPTYTNIGLVNATLGATIQTPSTGTIVERGIFWSTSPGVDETSNLISEGTDQAGVYTILSEWLERGTTIYFKGFVTNISGTIMSTESSFSNIPIFTGTGDWSTAARWNVQEVPGMNGDATYGSADDSPIINGTCTLTLENTVNNLTINNGSGRLLNINPGVSLTVNGTLDNNNGVGGLVLKSDATGTGSLMHASDNVSATVQRYISGTSDLEAKKYHLVSVPINSDTYLSEVWLYSYLFTYLEASDTWFAWDVPTTNILNAKEGAMVYYPNYVGGTTSRTYNITGQLNNGDYSPTITTTGNGYNLVPNPYPSAIDWDMVSQTNVENSIWIFNPDTKSYGVYNGSGTNGVTNIIPVGQAFFVNASGSGLTFDNTVRLHDHKAFMKAQKSVVDEFHMQVTGGEGSDELIVKLREDATLGKDNQYDATKFYSDLRVPQISSFTESNEDLLSINTVPFTTGVVTIPVRFDLNTAGEVTFIGSGFESFGDVSVRLEDTKENRLVKLEEAPVYSFQHETGDDPMRFKLHFVSTVGIDNPGGVQGFGAYATNRKLYLQYPEGQNSGFASLFDVQGREVSRYRLTGSGSDAFSIPASNGVYVVRFSDKSDAAFKIIVR